MNILNSIKNNWFNSAALLLGLILVINLFGGFTQLDFLWKKGGDKSLVTDEGKWQEWLNRNVDLFASLTDRAQIGITESLDSDYGVIWTKQKDSIGVRRSNQLRKVGSWHYS